MESVYFAQFTFIVYYNSMEYNMIFLVENFLIVGLQALYLQ